MPKSSRIVAGITVIPTSLCYQRRIPHHTVSTAVQRRRHGFESGGTIASLAEKIFDFHFLASGGKNIA